MAAAVTESLKFIYFCCCCCRNVSILTRVFLSTTIVCHAPMRLMTTIIRLIYSHDSSNLVSFYPLSFSPHLQTLAVSDGGELWINNTLAMRTNSTLLLYFHFTLKIISKSLTLLLLIRERCAYLWCELNLHYIYIYIMYKYTYYKYIYINLL